MKRNNVLYLGFPNRYFFEDRRGIHEWEKGVVDARLTISFLEIDGWE
jgi:hypothetical protein